MEGTKGGEVRQKPTTKAPSETERRLIALHGSSPAYRRVHVQHPRVPGHGWAAASVQAHLFSVSTPTREVTFAGLLQTGIIISGGQAGHAPIRSALWSPSASPKPFGFAASTALRLASAEQSCRSCRLLRGLPLSPGTHQQSANRLHRARL